MQRFTRHLRLPLCRLGRRPILMLGVALAVTLAGCAATGIKGAEMTEQVAQVPAGKARILIYRDGSLLGAAVQPNVMVNGEVVGTSKPGGFFYADVGVGTHEVSARTEVTSSVSFQMAEGQTRYVRTSITMGAFVGRIQFTLVEAEEAQRVLPGLAYTGPAVATAPSARSGTTPSGPAPSAPAPVAAPRNVTLDDLDGLLPKKP
jgi:Protein of unknown function (DUF2846)